MTQQPLFWVSTQKISKHFFANMYAPLCSLQHYSQWPRHGNNLMYLDRWLGKEDVVHIYSGMLLNHKKRWGTHICTKVEGSWEYHAKWGQSDRKLGAIWFHSYVGYKAESNKWTNKKNKQKFIDTDNGMVVTRGEGGRG